MTNCLNLKKSNCKNCYKCIRHCPVKSIRFEDNQAHIIKDECVLCGLCFVNCPQNAKEIRNDVPVAKKLIATGKPVIVSLAPSFVANYANATIESMKETLLKLGFSDVQETAIGATIVKKEYEKLIQEKKQDIIISTCCHTVNTLVQKYYPTLVSCLAPVPSPMLAHCAKIKKENPEAYTVFIGPCISKKDEADTYKGIVDCVLTYEELTQWLKDENMDYIKQDYVYQDYTKARLFPTSGGILQTMDKPEGDYQYLVIDGMDNCIAALKDIEKGNIAHCFIEMSACSGSCINGPVIDKHHRAPIRDYMAVHQYAGKKDFIVQQPSAEELYHPFKFLGVHQLQPTEQAIQEVLEKMGKTSKDKELNCGSCGYESCREKAIAILRGKAVPEMCLPFLKEKAESFSDNVVSNTPNGLMVLNEKLEIQLANKAMCHILNIQNPKDIIGAEVSTVLDPYPYANVLIENRNIKSKKVYLAEYQKYVEESIIYDAQYHILILIMRDITKEENERVSKEQLSKQTIDITDKVIEKQMRVVQEIASLLGETTAETKVALTKLKESLKDE